MRKLILATASAIVLGVAGAGPLYAADPNPAPAAPAATQTPSADTMQPATPQGGATMPQNSPSMSVNNQYNNADQANASQSSMDWPRVSRSDIQQVQQKLQQDGLYHGRIDGLSGPGTQQALRAYQRQHSLPVTATLDPQTLGSLGIGGAVGAGSSTPPNSSTEGNMAPGTNAGTNGANNPRQ